MTVKIEGQNLFLNHMHYSTTDRVARVSVKPGKPSQLNYSMQTAVDMSSHVITNIESHLADRRDSECLSQVLTNTIDNLKQLDLQVEEIAADTGYSSKALQACVDNNIVAYIPNFGQYKSFREGFTYSKEQDHYVCEKGILLPYKKTQTKTRKATIKSSTAAVVKTAAIAPYAPPALAVVLITKR